MLISATDLGIPQPCKADKNATVIVKVKRNEYAPVFTKQGTYRAEIKETTGVNNKVTSVSADDRDAEVGNTVVVSQIA